VKLMGMISFGAFIAHILACLWYMVGDVSDTLEHADGSTSTLRGWCDGRCVLFGGRSD
jgi:hypothetical protein